MTDSHLHSKYSHDGVQEVDDIVETALSKGLSYIAFTDHIDRDYLFVNYTMFRQIDLPAYVQAVLNCREKYKGKIKIALGAEMGFLPEASERYVEDIKNTPFDVIINSTHTVLGHDTFFPPFFETAGTQENGYREYLKAVRASLDVPYDYDIVAHVGYVQKNSPYEDNNLKYFDFKDIYDDILRTIIKKNKCLEVNSKINYGATQTMPNYEVLARYYELGGRIISFGSDAHRLPNIADKYDAVAAECKKLGFAGFTYFLERKPYLDKF